jgi:hypothetical protein
MTAFRSYIKVSDFPALPDEMDIFRPTTGMLRNSQAVFKDLKCADLTGPQKDYVARQCIDDGSDFRCGMSANEIKRRYNIPKGTAGTLITNFKYNIPNRTSSGRPAAIDEQGRQEFLQEVAEGKEVVDGKGRKRKHKKVLLNDPEIQGCLNKHARLTKQRRGHDVDIMDTDNSLCSKTATKLPKVTYVYILYKSYNI